MTDWYSTAANLATAGGTLVLAGATFASIRSGQRATRATERALLAGIRPVLMPSDLDDPEQKVTFMDRWMKVGGGRAVLEATDEAIYFLMSIRNVGNGLAVLDRWDATPERLQSELSADDLGHFRRLTRDIYVPAGRLGFWQGTIRSAEDPLFDPIRAAIAEHHAMTLDLLYGDQEGGQRTISRFGLMPADNGSWLASVSRHWNLDRPNPR